MCVSTYRGTALGMIWIPTRNATWLSRKSYLLLLCAWLHNYVSVHSTHNYAVVIINVALSDVTVSFRASPSYQELVLKA